MENRLQKLKITAKRNRKSGKPVKDTKLLRIILKTENLVLSTNSEVTF